MSLILEGVTLYRQQKLLLGPLNWSIAPGEIYTLMGPSGCGKSTLLAYLSGTLAEAFQAQGSISLNGRPLDGVPIAQRQIGILFQDPLLFPHLTAQENLIFAMSSGTLAQKRQQAQQLLAEAGLLELAERYPNQLSGGQSARISLLRTLQAHPAALLLDEPFAKLDGQTRQKFRDWVYQLIRLRNIPAILVTHDAEDIANPLHLLKLAPKEE